MVAPSAGDRARWSRSRSRPSRFVVLYAIGGTADVPLDSLAIAMVGVHVLIGIGEARHHRSSRSAASSPSGPTSCTAPDRCSSGASSWSARPTDRSRPREGERRHAPVRFASASCVVALRPRRASSATTPTSSPDGLNRGLAGQGLRPTRRRSTRRRRPARRLRREGRRQRAAVRRAGRCRRRARRARPRRWARASSYAVAGPPTPSGLTWAPGTATSCTSTATRRSTACRRT